jgi:TatD DNase family protein
MIDSHCHIDMPQFDADREAVLARARAAGVETMLVVGGVDAEAGHRRALVTAEVRGLPASAGVHPHEARLASPAVYDELGLLADRRRIVAIGEIGLDFHYDHSPRDVQREVFRAQVRLARQARLPVVVHTREADAETAALLEDEGAGEVGGVIHCFTGGHDLARRALALGFFISFSGILAFPRADVIQEVAREVPLDRLLVETDAPFLAPPPHRGKRNEPAFVVEVARKLAALRGAALEEIASASARNFRALFGVA